MHCATTKSASVSAVNAVSWARSANVDARRAITKSANASARNTSSSKATRAIEGNTESRDPSVPKVLVVCATVLKVLKDPRGLLPARHLDLSVPRVLKGIWDRLGLQSLPLDLSVHRDLWVYLDPRVPLLSPLARSVPRVLKDFLGPRVLPRFHLARSVLRVLKG